MYEFTARTQTKFYHHMLAKCKDSIIINPIHAKSANPSANETESLPPSRPPLQPGLICCFSVKSNADFFIILAAAADDRDDRNSWPQLLCKNSFGFSCWNKCGPNSGHVCICAFGVVWNRARERSPIVLGYIPQVIFKNVGGIHHGAILLLMDY